MKKAYESKTLWLFLPVFLVSVADIIKVIVANNFDWSNPAIYTAVLSALGVWLRLITDKGIQK